MKFLSQMLRTTLCGGVLVTSSIAARAQAIHGVTAQAIQGVTAQATHAATAHAISEQTAQVIPEAPAQAPVTSLSALHHNAWTIGKELPLVGVTGAARTPDGYLWLGSSAGLIRFDGVRFTLFNGSTTPSLKSAVVGATRVLFVDQAGTLWIARADNAFIQYRDRQFKLVLAPEPKRGHLTDAFQDRSGRLLFAQGAQLKIWQNGTLASFPLPSSVPDTGISGAVADSGNGFWIGTNSQGLWHVTGGRTEHLTNPHSPTDASVRPILQTRDGKLLVSGNGLQMYDGMRWTQFFVGGHFINAGSALERANGSLLFATLGDGIVLTRGDSLEKFSDEQGLSGGVADKILGDREGNIWAVTNGGLDQFRTSPFVTIGKKKGLPFATPLLAFDDAGGGVWAMDYDTRRTYHLRGGLIDGSNRAIQASVLPGTDIPIASGTSGGVWLYGLHSSRVYLARDGTMSPVRDSPALAWTGPRRGYQDATGTLWLTTSTALGTVNNDFYTPVPVGFELSRSVSPVRDDKNGHVFTSLFRDPRLVEIDRNRSVKTIDLSPALDAPLVDLTLEGPDTLIGITRSGRIARIIGGHATAIDVPELANAMTSFSASLIVASKWLWLGAQGGIARLPLAALHAALDKRTSTPTPVQWFGAADGLVTARITDNSPQPGFRAHDGRIWFSTPAGLAVVDPSINDSNSVAPRVFVEDIDADGHDAMLDSSIAPNPDRVNIRFTATALRIPERVRIEYQLNPVDRGWKKSGADRFVSYSQLRPGRYRFRVRAWNESGVPSESEASVIFRVLPAWYQTYWFAGLVLLAIAGAVAITPVALNRRRTARSIELMKSQFDATLSERTRIAQELHDTLLQGFAGVTLQLQAVQHYLPDRPELAAHNLSRALNRIDDTLREARQSVWELRSPELDDADLVDALSNKLHSAVADTAIAVSVVTHGVRRRLARAIEVTAFRVGCEAIANAVRHADAHAIALTIDFAAHGITIVVADDGCGFQPAEGDAARNGGHWGLVGMRERAAQMGGRIDVDTATSKGTSVKLFLPVGG